MNKEFLQKLLEVPSPSGNEDLGVKLWREQFQSLPFKEYYKDKSGNLAFSVGRGETKLLLSGHIDEICMAIRGIQENGFIIPIQMAGLDKKVLPGSEVLLLNDNLNVISGIVHKNPIHIEGSEKDQKDMAISFEDLRIDIGVELREEVEKYGLHVGSPIINGRHINLEHGPNRLYGNSLDDKSGVYIVEEVMMKLMEGPDQEWKNKYTVIGLACTGEESGLLGAYRAAHQINPDISIDIDVIHASDTGQFDTKKYGDIKLGKGPVIEWGQDKSRRLNKILKSMGIETQDGVSRIGGTNTKEFYLESADAETTLISIPLLSMHTPTETMDWRDINGAINLLTKSILECKL